MLKFDFENRSVLNTFLEAEGHMYTLLSTRIASPRLSSGDLPMSMVALTFHRRAIAIGESMTDCFSMYWPDAQTRIPHFSELTFITIFCFASGYLSSARWNESA